VEPRAAGAFTAAYTENGFHFQVPAVAEPPTPTPTVHLLSDLPPGARCVVESIDASNAIGRRLIELGFAPATPVEVVRRAPLGDPVVYELRGTRLCLRRAEARRVRVRPE
jgi:ferrous iron transport protein A